MPVLLILLHLLLSSCRKEDILLMALLLTVGGTVDGLLNVLHFFTFTVDTLPIPLWLAVLWIGLATLPHHSLAWMKNRPLLSALFGAVGGPLAYLAGVRFDAAMFNLPTSLSLSILAVIWAVLWPAVMYAAQKIKPENKNTQTA